MSNEYLSERDVKTIKKAEAILENLPYYIRQFYDSKKSSKSELTRLSYVQDLRTFLEYLAPIHHCEIKDFPFENFELLTAQDINDYKEYLLEKYSEPSVKRKLASLSTFYKYLVIAGFVEKNPAAIIEWPQETKNRPIIYLDEEQTAKLLNGIKSNDKQIFYRDKENNLKKSSRAEKGYIRGKAGNKNWDYEVGDIDETTRRRRDRVRNRNYLITALFLKTGVRVSELVNINIENIDFRNNIIMVTGKGNKVRPVGFGKGEIAEAMKEYIAADRRALLNGNYQEPALFVSNAGKRISVRQIEDMIKEMVLTYLHDDESIPKRDFSPHKLRSSCATRLLKQTNGNIKGVSDLLGHESIDITARRYAAIVKLENAEAMAEYGITESE